MPDDLQAQINELSGYVRSWTGRVMQLDNALAPYWLREGQIKHSIRHSYTHCVDGAVLKYDRAGAEVRFGLYAEWVRLVIQYGPAKEERRHTQADIDSAMRHVAHLRKLLEKSYVQRTKVARK